MWDWKSLQTVARRRCHLQPGRPGHAMLKVTGVQGRCQKSNWAAFPSQPERQGTRLDFCGSMPHCGLWCFQQRKEPCDRHLLSVACPQWDPSSQLGLKLQTPGTAMCDWPCVPHTSVGRPLGTIALLDLSPSSLAPLGDAGSLAVSQREAASWLT